MRAAIGCANAAVLPLQARIMFAIPDTDPGFVDVDAHLAGDPDADPGVRDAFVINPISELPTLDNVFGHGITLDARTQTDFTGDTNPFGPEVVLDGESGILAPPIDTGLRIFSNDNRVFGLNIQRFEEAGIQIGSGMEPLALPKNWIAYNSIGSDATGTRARGNGTGIAIIDSGISLRSGTLIGTNGDGIDDRREGNLISGNHGEGIVVQDGVGTKIAGNFIGTTRRGEHALAHQSHGVRLTGAQGTTVGTDGDGNGDEREGNLISGNAANGIDIQGVRTALNRVAGNLIGTDAEGVVALGNGGQGVRVREARRTRVGTNGDGTSDLVERNIISGNASNGALLTGATNSFVAGNLIGTDKNGTSELPNSGNGVSIFGARQNTIGTNGSDDPHNGHERNVISGNELLGVAIAGSSASHNVVADNNIGVDAHGEESLAGQLIGVVIGGARKDAGSSDNRVGTDGDGTADETERNVISGNLATGIHIIGEGTTGNTIAGNFLGTDEEGTTALPNGGNGIAVTGGTSSNQIGVAETDDGGNVIAGNRVFVAGTGTEENIVIANFIGVGAKGDRLIGNGAHGVLISDDAAVNRVGSDGDGKLDEFEGNEIAGNRGDGVRVLSAASDGNSIRRNAIHTNVGLGIDLAGDSVTRNDRRDRDSGPNELQNFPEFRAIITRRGLGLRGRLDSLPETEFIIDVYASTERDPSGHGEGKRWLGSFTVNTNRGGMARINELLAVSVAPDEVVTATATDPVGNTSEFSAAEAVRGRVARERKGGLTEQDRKD